MKWLGIDQSLGNAGWVVLEDEAAIASGVISTTHSDYSGIVDSLYRCQQATAMFAELLMTLAPDAVACEYPAVRGYRTESSLLAASALVSAASLAGVKELTVVNAQRVRKHFGAVNKAGLKKVLSERVDHSECKLWNQHITDALGIALCAREGVGTKLELP